MAVLNPMSSKLKSLHDVYPSIEGSMKASQSAICESLDKVTKQVEIAIDGISSASSDAQVTEAKSCLVLSNDGLKRVKSHVEGDLTPLFANCAEVEEYCKSIEKLHKEGANWKPAWYEQVWNSTIGALVREWRIGDQKKIDAANAEIDRLNQKGEAQLNAMHNAIDAVEFGVKGNMHSGGALGNSVAYGDNYSFNSDAWEAQNPQYTSNLLTKTGSLALGAVEGVFKIGENVLDAGATLVAGVVSLFNPDAGKSVANFAAKDLVGSAADKVSDVLGLHDDNFRNAGKFVGSTVMHGALWISGAGAVVSAISIGGNSMESSLKASGGENIWGAFGKGAVVGLSSYALGHLGKAAGAKFSNWAKGSGANTVVGKAYSAVEKAVGTSFGSDWSNSLQKSTAVGTFVNKAVNIAASPLRGMSNLMTKTAGALNGLGSNSSLWKGMGNLDAKADGVATKLVDGVSGIFGRIPRPGHAQAQPQGQAQGQQQGQTQSQPQGQAQGQQQGQTQSQPQGQAQGQQQGQTQSQPQGQAQGQQQGQTQSQPQGQAQGQQQGQT